MKILGLYDRSGPKYHRIFLPLMLMGADHVFSDELTEENADVDIVFFNRVISRQSINSVLDLQKRFGFKLVADFDDHWNLGQDHLLTDHYKHTMATEIMIEYIKISDAVFVTHERLYLDAAKLNENCHILRNAIPHVAQFAFNKITEDKIRFFWAGSITHKKDIKLLKEPVKRINRPGIKWVMGGYGINKESLAMASWFTNGGRFEHELIQAMHVEHYYGCYAKCDIALIPLTESKFNSHKSNLKVLEAANIEAPVIVSKVDPYLDLPVRYAEKQSDWFKHADYLIKNPLAIIEEGKKLKEYCDKYFNFYQINEERKQILEYVAGKQSKVGKIPTAIRNVG